MPAPRFIAAAFATLLALGFATSAMAQGCDALRAACTTAGFLEGGARGGKGVAANCMNPLLNGTKPPGNGKLALPVVAADMIAACTADKAKGSKTKGVTASTLGASRVAPGPMPVAPLPLPAGTAPGPNIVVVLVDDFSLDLMTTQNGVLAASMPNLARMQKEGVTFTKYFVTDSLCCPSRTSIFTGLLPHNSGVYTNSPPDGGLEAFMAQGDDAKTFAVALHMQFYQTAMMGKYLNGYQPDKNGVPQGWSDWAVAGNGYPNFNYVLNQNGALTTSPLHLTDQLSALGQDFIKQAAAGPFFLEIATFSPHAPYTPPARYADAFPDLTYPKTPAYGARPDANAPTWLKAIPALDQKTMGKIDEIYRNRVRSDKGVDDMIGAVRQTLADLGLSATTYVIFTSDNGYHMGEYSLRPGKMTPFDTDIRVPLVVVGPGIAAGGTVDAITMNIDFYPTFTELAGLPANANVDGRSLVALLHGKPGPWRNIAVVEHKNTAPDPENPDLPGAKAGNPPTYVALRMADALYVEYLDGSGEVGYYDMTTDPDQLHNIAHTLTPARLAALHGAAVANHTCAGAAECGAAQAMLP